MKFVLVNCILLILLKLHKYVQSDESVCSQKCTCKPNSLKDGANYLKMVCGEEEKISHLDELELLNLASELFQLNLSNNNLKNFSLKVELIALQKLNLSGNEITQLDEYQFREAPHLRRLDLSANKISHIDIKAFDGLKHLERLRLNFNLISSIAIGTFDAVPNLKQLDISNNPLQCDCGLLWLLDYMQKHSLKLISNPKCNTPHTFKGLSLRKLRIGVDIYCKSTSYANGLPLLDLKPEHNQVVFEGDSLQLHCRAPSITDVREDLRIEWIWLDKNPKDLFNDIIIRNNFFPSTGMLDSILNLKKLKMAHSGIWTCLFSSGQGNHSKSVTIVVLSDYTKYCPILTTKSNKGLYVWPKTVANHTVTMPCESLNLNYDVTSQIVTHHCSVDGIWLKLNTSQCSYISDTTRILEQFTKVNSSLLESARHFKNFTSNINIYNDPMDFIFTMETMESYLNLQPTETLANIVMDVVDNLMNLPSHYLWQVNKTHGVFSRLISLTEKIVLNHPATLFQRENLLIESFPTEKENFPGLKCTLYTNPPNRFDSLFSCSTNNLYNASMLRGKMVETSVTILNLLSTAKNEIKPNGNYYSFIVSMHNSSKFFKINTDDAKVERLVSMVVGVKLVGLPILDISTSVMVTVRIPHTITYDNTPTSFTPVHWEESRSEWSPQGCYLVQRVSDYITFTCHKLGYYGLLEDVSFMNKIPPMFFPVYHPAVFIGNSVLFMSFLIAILTYIFRFSSIIMPKSLKHCLINTWTSVALLAFIFSFGINQTEDQKLCQWIGLILHYLSMCTMLWMCTTVSMMHQRLTKNTESILQDDDLPSDQPIKKPVLGLYLVGWGVALIICGLSAAINIKEYSSPYRCFLRSGPALSAFVVPFLIFFFFIMIYFLLIRCAIHNLDLSHGGHLSVGTQATENVDLDLLDPNYSNPENRSVRTYSSKTASTELEDNERSPSAQLKAHFIFLVLFLISYGSCYLATSPLLRFFNYDIDLFSVVYAIFDITLSAFTLFFYCIARNDVRTQWGLMFRWMRRKRLLRSRGVCDTPPRVPIQPLPLPPIPQQIESQALSRSSSRSSGRAKANSMKGFQPPSTVDLNGSVSDRTSIGGAMINNINLVALHRAQYRSHLVPHIIENPTNAAEVFYNPHQSTAARKFFRRQRKDMMKRNNLQPKPPRDVNSDATSVFSEPKHNIKNKNNAEQNMFGTNSKVNNTNIHVEHIRKSQRKNPNIFSDSADEFDYISDVPIDKIVINAERLRKKEISRNRPRKKSNLQQEIVSQPVVTQMRTVSQQCTLEYSSENIVSDSILDKSDALSPTLSPVKIIPASLKRTHIDDSNINSPLETSIRTNLTMHLSSRRENSPVDDEHHYEEIADIRRDQSATVIRRGSGDDRFLVDNSKTNRYLSRIRSPSNLSRLSSASATDIDELYQQIRRGPLIDSRQSTRQAHYSTHNMFGRQRARSSPFLSDSEVTAISELRRNHVINYVDSMSSADVETTV